MTKQPCDAEPVEGRARTYRKNDRHDAPVMRGIICKSEERKKSKNHENGTRIGDTHDQSLHEICKRHRSSRSLLHFPERIRETHRDTKNGDNDASHDEDYVLMSLYELLHYGKSKDCNHSIQSVHYCGAKSGNVASSLAVDVFVQEVKRTWVGGMDPDKADQMLKNAVKLANFTVYDQAQQFEEFTGMGTTLVAALIADNRLYATNVGDSRLYFILDGEFRIISPKGEVTVDWGNGVLYDEEKRWQDYKAMVAQGLLAPEVALGWRFGLPADTPEERKIIRQKYMPR